jgi:hypothetical protein
MNDDDSTDAGKARSVWNAARIPNAEQPDDGTFAQLGEKLAQAAEWYRHAETRRPPGENARLKSIEETADKLARLLAQNPSTHSRLEEVWPLHFGRIELQQARLGIAIIRKTARRARIVEANGETAVSKGGGAVLREKFGSPQQLFVRLAARAYEEASGRDPGVSRDAYASKLSGPFVRFVDEAASQFGVPKLSAETIKKTLRRENTHG